MKADKPTLLLDPSTTLPYQGCDVCRHFDPQGLPRCAAYPEGIPLPILGGDIAHDRPLPGDHGIRFEPMAAEALRAREGRLAVDGDDAEPAGQHPSIQRTG